MHLYVLRGKVYEWREDNGDSSSRGHLLSFKNVNEFHLLFESYHKLVSLSLQLSVLSHKPVSTLAFLLAGVLE